MSQIQTKWIANNAVTNAKLAQSGAFTLLGNNTAGTANILSLSVAQVNAMLPIFTSSLNGLAPASGGGTTNFLRADGTWAAPSGAGTVTSVAFADGSSSPIFSISGSPITGAGTITETLVNQSANMVFAGPSTGSPAQPTFRALVVADIPSLSGLYLPLTGGTMSGSINMGSNSITSLAAPVNPNDAVTKAYVDNFINATSWKTAVLVATTANITLSGEQTIDGVLTSASRVLVKNQSTVANNGIYVSASGAWSRSSDMNTWAEVPAAAVFVQEGTVNADIGFVCTSQPGGTLGTTAITFVQFSSAGAYSADGVTLQLVSGVFSIKNGGVGTTQLGSITDGVTLDQSGAGSTLEIKSGGVGTTQLAAAAVTPAKLGTVTDGLTTNQSGSGSTIQGLEPVSYAYTLTATDITNQYVDITTGNGFPASRPAYGTTALKNSVMVEPNGGPMQNKGVDFTVSLTGGSGGSTRVSFSGDLATNAANGDVLTFSYSYL